MVVVETLHGFERRTGTSQKTGRPYDFFVLHLLSKQKGVTGIAAVQLTVDPAIVGSLVLKAGEKYDLDLDLQGDCLGIAPHED